MEGRVGVSCNLFFDTFKYSTKHSNYTGAKLIWVDIIFYLPETPKMF